MNSWAGKWTQNPSATPLQPIKWNVSFWIVFTSDDKPGWLMDSNPICHPSPAKKWNATFWITFNFWWLAGLVNGLKPHPPPLSSHRNEMLIFVLCSTSNDQPGLSMDLNPIHHLSPAKKWNAHILIMFNFWWSAWLIDELEPHLPPLSSQKNEMLNFRLRSTSDDQPDWSMDSNPICHPSPAKKMKCSFLYYIQLLMLARLVNELEPQLPSLSSQEKWNAHFWITFNFWWFSGLVDGLKLHPPPLSSQRNEMLIFLLCSTSDDQLGWSMDSNPICQPSPAKEMKSSFLDYVKLLMISWAGIWTQTPSATPLQPRKWNATFWIVFTSDDKPGWLMDSNPICHPSPAKKWNAHFWITFNFWWLAGLVNGLKPHPPPISSQRNEMLIFVLCSTSNDQPGLSMDLNPIHHLSPAKKWNAHILIMFNFWWSAWLIDELEPHLPLLSRQKKWNAQFSITFNFWWSAKLVNWLKPHPPPFSSQ